MVTTITKWTTGEWGASISRSLHFSHYSLEITNLTKFTRFITYSAHQLINSFRNFKSKYIQDIDWVFRVASHMEFNFPKKEGSGIAKLIPNVSPEA